MNAFESAKESEPHLAKPAYVFPLIAVAVAIYSILERIIGPDRIVQELGRPIIEVTVSTHERVQVLVSDLFLLAVFALLFFEIMKASTIGVYAYIDHLLSALIAAICIYSFLFLPGFGTMTFLYISLATVFDVVAGIFISRRTEHHTVELVGAGKS